MTLANGEVIIGLDGEFLYGTAGATATTEALNVEDVSLNLGVAAEDITRRGATFEIEKVILLNAELSFTLQKRVGDAFLAAIETAYLAKTRIALYPKSHSAGKGLNADYYIHGFTDGQPLKGKQTYEVTAKPTDEERTPAFE